MIALFLMPPKKTAPKRPVKRSAKKPESRIEDLPATDRIPLLLYRRIAITFTVLVVAALLIVVYLSTMQAVIRVRPTQTVLKTEFIAQAVSVPVADTDIAGEVRSGSVGKTETITASGTGAVEQEDFATGKVVIHNDLSTAQPLVAKTRLLSADGVQVRLTETVTVPAKGTVEASVKADEKGKAGNVPAGRFTVPGLNEAKQKLVYAESSEAFTGGVRSMAVVSQEEIDTAVAALRTRLLEDAKSMLRSQGTTMSGEAFFDEVTEQKVSIEPNTQADRFDVTLGITVTGAFFDKDAIVKIADRKLYDQVGQGHELVAIDHDRMVLTVDKVNKEEQTASLRVELTGQAITSRTSKALDLNRFLGMTEDEVTNLLMSEEVATEVNVDFFPFWVRTIPRLKDHVYIKIN